MKSDELEKAFSALRAETHGREPRARATLARVLVTSRRESKRRLRLFKLWLPLAAVLVASSAWAAARGHFTNLLSNAPTLEPTHRGAFASSVEVEPEGPRFFATSQVTAAPEPIPATASASSRPTASTSPSGSASLALEKAAYEAAYRAHAKAGAGDVDAANAAVAAWDSYLARFPEGRFQPEARYARAVALARAGRNGEAKGAMEPFAKGDGYRKADAERWIQSIEREKAPVEKP